MSFLLTRWVLSKTKITESVNTQQNCTTDKLYSFPVATFLQKIYTAGHYLRRMGLLGFC